MERAISTITVLPSSKEEVKSFVEKAKEEILSGNESALKIECQLKAFEEVIKQLRSDNDIKYAVLDEAERYGTKTFEEYGAKITIRDGGRYNYNNCEDSVYQDLIEQQNEIKEKIKKRTEFLKTVPEEGTVNPDTGEFIKPAIKEGKTQISIQLK
jgi:hypothetical protein